jgi:1-acyl-sn-glycerol-3-phosphate acyltransferase
LLAVEQNKLIVPVAHNAGSYWPRRGWMKKPGTVRVVIGPPIEPGGRDPREINKQVQDWIESTVSSLAG